MIKDVMVRLDGTSADDVRLAAVNLIADIFDSHITGLFFNVLPSLIPDGPNGALAPIKPPACWILPRRRVTLSKPRFFSA